MNEQIAALWSILVAELGASLYLAVMQPDSSLFGTVQTPARLLVPRMCTFNLVTTVFAGICWIVAPKMWRLRQRMSSKIHVLIWISVVFLVVEMGVSLLFFEAGSTWFRASADFDDHTGTLCSD